MFHRIAFTILFLVGFISAYSQVFDAVIAADGSGDYTSIQSAIDRIRSSADRHFFYVEAGTYIEKVSIAKDNISLIGAGVDQVIISWADYSGDDDGHSTATSYTFEASGDNFYAENITFENTAGDVGQAVAVSTTGVHQVFRNCRFLGFQDTYYARTGIQYLSDCYIEGATDFIFGESTAVFDQCEIVCLEGGHYITAPADTKLISEVNGAPFYHGLLFLDSEIIAGAGVADDSYYMGRPWQANSTSVFINSTLGSHIKPEGWSEWNDNNHLSAFFAEYNSLEENGEPVDISSRVDWSTQLTEGQVDNYDLDFFLNGWDAKASIEPVDVPIDLTAGFQGGSILISWAPVEGAIGYVILKNNEFLKFSEVTIFSDPEGSSGDIYAVASVSTFGVFSEFSTRVSGQLLPSQMWDVNHEIRNGVLLMSKPVDVEVYSLTGQIRIKRYNQKQVNLNPLKNGVYLIKLVDSNGNTIVHKVAI